MKKWIKITTIAALPIAAVALFGFAKGITGPSLNGHSIQQKTLTAKQREEIVKNIQSITMPTGIFVRTDKPGNFNPNQVTHSEDEALKNPNIQEIVLPYGTFVRTTKEGLKQHQLEWQKQHPGVRP
ncbi:hypothetical protein LSG31_16830 [Fodinisporobacter ferrooxydans]|uniref:Uncharacterized protein n=1 Tax=Fodinisporobacter ferrooxydans TaxID=2901836 RepID=A0ABY4CK45_9BACL|nr:hypothetical protein LSG31_16830 [Alicyclobacillaceae bacterium MYW30-H2]